uniref:Uncharacterized protein n=1 Tax=Arion vulgaris TaxID=1028688 RepID=A0A0B6Z427_9EUPU
MSKLALQMNFHNIQGEEASTDDRSKTSTTDKVQHHLLPTCVVLRTIKLKIFSA